jgi:hypothetical protein
VCVWSAALNILFLLSISKEYVQNMQNHEKNTQKYVENPYVENPNQNTKNHVKNEGTAPLLIVDRLQSVLETHAYFVKKS